MSCNVCGTEATYQCKRCKSVLYCSNECKSIGWKQGHKSECQPSPINYVLGDDGETKMLKLNIVYGYEGDEPDRRPEAIVTKEPFNVTIREIVERYARSYVGTMGGDDEHIYRWPAEAVWKNEDDLWTRHFGFNQQGLLTETMSAEGVREANARLLQEEDDFTSDVLVIIIYGPPQRTGSERSGRGPRMGINSTIDINDSTNQGRKISSKLVGAKCAPQPMPELISKSRLTYGKELGKGAFGVVIAGTYDGNPVAIKTIQGTPTAEAIKDFSEEAQLLGNISAHRNVVQFIGITRDPLMLVTELVTGGGLDSRLEPGKPSVSWQNIISWARDIARGIRHLHANRVLHRDLAARNVLLDNQGVAKVTDFGLSRRICTLDPDLRFRQQEFFRGPYRWMPPESLAYQDFSVKSDVWAYGVTLWEIMSRRLPYEFVTDINIVKEWIIGRNMTLPLHLEWPQRMRDIMTSCWKPSPDDRIDMLDISSILKSIGDTGYNGRPLPAIEDKDALQLYGQSPVLRRD